MDINLEQHHTPFVKPPSQQLLHQTSSASASTHVPLLSSFKVRPSSLAVSTRHTRTTYPSLIFSHQTLRKNHQHQRNVPQPSRIHHGHPFLFPHSACTIATPTPPHHLCLVLTNHSPLENHPPPRNLAHATPQPPHNPSHPFPLLKHPRTRLRHLRPPRSRRRSLGTKVHADRPNLRPETCVPKFGGECCGV